MCPAWANTDANTPLRFIVASYPAGTAKRVINPSAAATSAIPILFANAGFP